MPPVFEGYPVFDGHNDTLLRLWLADDAAGTGFTEGRDDTHIDAIRARKGGLMGGFFAIFVPTGGKNTSILRKGELDQKGAETATGEMISILDAISTQHPDLLRQCRGHDDILRAQGADAMAAILHFEGAEAILPDLSNLEEYYRLGLRSIGPVWSRSNAFGHGVPMSFPGSPDQGDGLTGAGKELVRACDQLGIMLDLSHLNAAGMRDIAAISTRPLIATHSNCHALSASPRNLTAWQLDAIVESGGLVGLNFASGFLREDGRKSRDTDIDIMIRHLDALLDSLGEEGVALGSDFDGAIIPSAIGDCTGLPRLVAAMEKAGYGDELISSICSTNWLRQIKVQIG